MSVRTILLAAGAPNTRPNNFVVPSQLDVAPSSVCTSAAVTLTGYNETTTISVSGDGGEISVAGGAYTTSTIISPGQSFTVRLTAASGLGYQSTTTTVTAGGVSSPFSVTTGPL